MAKANAVPSLFLDQQPIQDLLSVIDSGSECLIIASEYVPDAEELRQAIYGICAAMRAVCQSVRKSGLAEALSLNSRHPDFEMARTSIRLSRDLASQALPEQANQGKG
jgi:hypothetical protein